MANPALFVLWEQYTRFLAPDCNRRQLLVSVLGEAAKQETAAPEVRKGWGKENPLQGHEDVVALVLEDLLGLRLALLTLPDGKQVLGNVAWRSCSGDDAPQVLLNGEPAQMDAREVIRREQLLASKGARHSHLSLRYDWFSGQVHWRLASAFT